jgi:DNA-binding LacI/PurR family transcriptional regulator
MVTHAIDRGAGGVETVVVSPSVGYITEALDERIRAGVYAVGHRLPSERSLSEEFGVSRITIRLVIPELERRGLVVCAARCRPIVRDPGQRGDAVVRRTTPPARSATVRRSLSLWIWPSPSWPGSAMIVRGIRHVLNQDDFRLVLDSATGHDTTTSNDSLDEGELLQKSEEAFLKRIVRDHDIEGVLLWYLGGSQNLPALRDLRAAGVPMVFLDRMPPPGFEADFVGVDNVGTAEAVVNHLLTQGHRCVAHVTNYDNASTVQERTEGYRRALSRAGVTPRPEWIVREPAMAAVNTLLALPEPPTAVFAVNDVTGLGVVEALRAHDLRVPEDMAVAGFDGIERWLPGTPFLTTAAQPFERMGAAAADLLLRRINEGPDVPCRHMLLDAPLAVHGSTGPLQRPAGHL